MVDNTLPAEQKAAVEWKYTRLHDAAASIQASQYIALGMKYFFATHDNIRELVREQQESLEPAGYLIWQTPSTLKTEAFYRGLCRYATFGLLLPGIYMFIGH